MAVWLLRSASKPQILTLDPATYRLFGPPRNADRRPAPFPGPIGGPIPRMSEDPGYAGFHSKAPASEREDLRRDPPQRYDPRMKMATAAALIMMLAPGAIDLAGAKTMDDKAEILRLEGQFIAAWNKGDPRAAAAVYAEDGVRVGAFGDVSQGREAIEAAYAKLLGETMKGATVEWQPSVRLLTLDIGLAQGPLVIHPAGAAAPIRGYALDIWRKSAGSWHLVEGHPKLFPPPPPQR